MTHGPWVMGQMKGRENTILVKKYAVDWILVIVGCDAGGEYKNLEFFNHEWSEHELIWHTESSDICEIHVYFSNFQIFHKK